MRERTLGYAVGGHTREDVTCEGRRSSGGSPEIGAVRRRIDAELDASSTVAFADHGVSGSYGAKDLGRVDRTCWMPSRDQVMRWKDGAESASATSQVKLHRPDFQRSSNENPPKLFTPISVRS